MKYRAGDFSNNETRIFWNFLKESGRWLEFADELLVNEKILEQMQFNLACMLAKAIREEYEGNGFVPASSISPSVINVRWIEIAQYFLSEAVGQSS